MTSRPSANAGALQHLSESGLLPSPIALPDGQQLPRHCIRRDGDALYFVARGDGSHEFSATLEKHNAAVRKFQLRKRATNYRSRPTG
ncbi:MAG: endolytic transglycosylase MltG [Anaerolineales bacterium]|nr:endolytic transglycosylase MltG [Anaerolineales bacterium]